MSSWEPYNAATSLPIPQSLNLPPVSGVHRGNLNHHNSLQHTLGPPVSSGPGGPPHHHTQPSSTLSSSSSSPTSIHNPHHSLPHPHGLLHHLHHGHGVGVHGQPTSPSAYGVGMSSLQQNQSQNQLGQLSHSPHSIQNLSPPPPYHNQQQPPQQQQSSPSSQISSPQLQHSHLPSLSFHHNHNPQQIGSHHHLTQQHPQQQHHHQNPSSIQGQGGVQGHQVSSVVTSASSGLGGPISVTHPVHPLPHHPLAVQGHPHPHQHSLQSPHQHTLGQHLPPHTSQSLSHQLPQHPHQHPHSHPHSVVSSNPPSLASLPPGLSPVHLQHPHQHPLQHPHPLQLQSQGLSQPFNLKPTNSPNPVTGPLTPTPVPHAPQGSPAINPFSNGPGGQEHDLPPELLSLGWRKFWSKRENRWYFWNCQNGESLWEVPPLPGRPHQPGLGHPPPPGHHVYDPLTDPLGIQCGNGPPAGNLGLKRRVSSGDTLGSPSIKKFILAGPWDLEINSNVFVPDAALPLKHLLPPHPEIEQLRAQLVAKLRQCYQQACQSRETIDAPKESLNRWFMEQKITDLRGIDPIFPTCENPEGAASSSMLKEIMNDIPIKLVKSRYTGDARKQLSKFAEACKRTVETRNTSCDEARKVVKWKVEETFSWLRATSNASYEALMERLAHLKVTCQPHVHAAAKSSVEGICKKMSILSKQYSQQVRDAHLKLFVDPQNVKIEGEPEKGKFRCYSAQCGPYVFTEAGRLPSVDFLQTDRDHAALKFKADAVRISTQYLQKLEQLYRYHSIDDRKFEFFLVRSYCLLKRYNAFCEDFVSSQSTQGSLPVPVFESIQRNFGVTFECFSSPFNCYFRHYCSAFADTDGYFGSRGSFFDFHPIAGSFQMNPPFCEEIIIAAISHAEELLAGTRDPMSFIVFVPEFADDAGVSDNDCSWLKRLDSSRWKRKQITVPAYEHEYRHAALHYVPKSEVNIRASHSTVVVWLQNEAGFEEWRPTDHKVDALIDAYRPGRERERDRQDLLSPERQNPHQADKAVAAAAAAATVVST